MSTSRFKISRRARRALPGHKPKPTAEELAQQAVEDEANRVEREREEMRQALLQSIQADDAVLLNAMSQLQNKMNDAEQVKRDNPSRIAQIDEHTKMMRRARRMGIVAQIVFASLIVTMIVVIKVLIPVFGMVVAIGVIGASRLMLRLTMATNDANRAKLVREIENADLVLETAPMELVELEAELEKQKKEREEAEKQIVAAIPALNTKVSCPDCGERPYANEDVEDWASAHHAMTGH